MMSTRILACVTAATLAATPLLAQDSLVAGARVRVSAPSRGVEYEVGTLVAVPGDSIVVRFEKGGVQAFAAPSVTHLEMHSPGENEAGAGFVIGLFGGVLVGYAIGYATGSGPAKPASSSCYTCGLDARGLAAGASAVLFGMAGGVLGLVIGAASEAWHPAPGWHVTPQVSVGARTSQIGVSLAF